MPIVPSALSRTSCGWSTACGVIDAVMLPNTDLEGRICSSRHIPADRRGNVIAPNGINAGLEQSSE
jgi:hypothetical protein